MRPFWLAACLLLISPLPSLGQEIPEPRGTYALEGAYLKEDIFPYVWLRFGMDLHGIGIKTSAVVSEDKFVMVWKPSFRGNRRRLVSCFDSKAKLLWESELNISNNENLIYIFAQDGMVNLLSYRFDPQTRAHQILAHRYEAQEGEYISSQTLFMVIGDRVEPVGFNFSPDGQQILLYVFENQVKRPSITQLTQFPLGEWNLGQKITNVSHLRFVRLSRNFDTLQSATFPIDVWLREKSYALDCQLDNAGNIYVPVFKRPEALRIVQFDASLNESREMVFQPYPDPFNDPPYDARLVPEVGNNGSIFAVTAKRVKNRGKKEIESLQVIEFDFDHMRLDQKRYVEITSGFRVKVAKEREAVKLRPNVPFDHYEIREVIELPDQSLWVVTQRYLKNRQLEYINGVQAATSFDTRHEDIILYEFSPEGKVQKAIIIPVIQRAENLRERMTRNYQLNVFPDRMRIDMITREAPSGKPYKAPMLYKRSINLKDGTFTGPYPIYDGRRRDQYHVPTYTAWLNESIAALLLLDGEGEAIPKVVTVPLDRK
ncbi:MAG: hypothetical protein AAGI38_16815 [Bacteroidota bacterium]